MIRFLPPLRISVPMIILIFGCALGGWWSYQTRQRGYEQVQQSQLQATRLIAAFAIPQVEAFYRRGEIERAQTFLNRLNADRDLRRVVLADAQGTILYSAQFADKGSDMEPALASFATEALAIDRDLVRMEGDIIRSAFPVRLTPEAGGLSEANGVLLMERDMHFLRELARHNARFDLLSTVAIILVLGVVTAGILHQIITRRLHRLIHATQRLAGGERGVRASLSGHDELAQIGQAFDETALRIEVAQKQLRDRERMFSRLIENGNDIIALVDAGGVIQFVSPSVHRTLGVFPEEMLGRSLFEFVHPDDLGGTERAFAELMEGAHRPHAIDLRLRRVDGEWVLVEAVGNVLHDRGGHELVINARDITEWKTLQDRLRQSEKMQAVGQLAGGIAHDFNNLLTVITGYTGLLARECKPGSAAAEHLEEVRKAAERGSKLVGQLLAFSRKQVLKPQDVDLNRVIRDLEILLRRTLGEQITLELHLSDVAATVRADQTQLDQVLVNLAVNARQAMPQGGVLRICTRIIEQRDLPAQAREAGLAEECVLLQVEDTGGGIDPDILDRIFDPFFTSRPAGQGTGLGLATVHGIVNQSNGAIWVESSLGEGTTFRICLPHIEVDPQAVESAGRVKVVPSFAPGRALVVEDAPPVRNLVARALREAGYQVVTAENVAAACEHLRKSVDDPPDVIVSDLVLPDGSGRQVAELAVNELPATAIVLMSGYDEEMVGSIDSTLPFVFIAKPFAPEALIEAVGEARSAVDEARSHGKSTS